jgi:hypothetical protein
VKAKAASPTAKTAVDREARARTAAEHISQRPRTSRELPTTRDGGRLTAFAVWPWDYTSPVLALPAGPGLVGAVLLGVGCALAGCCFVLALRGLRPLLAGSAPAGAGVAGLAAIAAAAAIGFTPYASWRIVQDLRYTVQIPEFVAERIGAYERDLDGAAFDRVAAIIPKGDTYFTAAGPAPGASEFPQWSAAALVPRMPVRDVEDADWVVALDVDPHTLGVPVEKVRRIPTSYGRQATIYVARVAR